MRRLPFYILFATCGIWTINCNDDKERRTIEESEVGLEKNFTHRQYKRDPKIHHSIIREDDIENKIVGGAFVSKGEFPWVVGIWRLKSSRPFCGGSLLNNRYKSHYVIICQV